MRHLLEWSCCLLLPESLPARVEVESAFQKIIERQCQKDSLDDSFCVHLILVDDAEMRAINFDTRGKDTSTDVLSFPLLSIPTGPGTSAFRNKKPQSIQIQLQTQEPMLFLGPEKCIALGEIVISISACLRQAQEIGHSPKEEFYRLFVHGLLHLFGYDHETSPEDRRRMERQEDELLGLL